MKFRALICLAAFIMLLGSAVYATAGALDDATAQGANRRLYDISDYNSDGCPDLMWHNSEVSPGNVVFWMMAADTGGSCTKLGAEYFLTYPGNNTIFPLGPQWNIRDVYYNGAYNATAQNNTVYFWNSSTYQVILLDLGGENGTTLIPNATDSDDGTGDGQTKALYKNFIVDPDSKRISGITGFTFWP